MKLVFEGDVDELEEFAGLIRVELQKPEPDDVTVEDLIGFDELTFMEDDDKPEGVSATAESASEKHIGPVQRVILARKWVRSGQRLKTFMQLSNDEVVGAFSTVAMQKGVASVSAIGDGAILKAFLDFISAHWDEILKILLSLI